MQSVWTNLYLYALANISSVSLMVTLDSSNSISGSPFTFFFFFFSASNFALATSIYSAFKVSYSSLIASPASPPVFRYSSTTSFINMWGILKCLANNFEKWVFPAAVGPWINILLGLNCLNSLNSWHTLIIFLGKPSLQCQLNLNLGGASGFSSSPSS